MVSSLRAPQTGQVIVDCRLIAASGEGIAEQREDRRQGQRLGRAPTSTQPAAASSSQRVPKPARSASRYRMYAPGDVQRLIFIRPARELGFTLDEIRDLLRLAADVADPCAAVRDV